MLLGVDLIYPLCILSVADLGLHLTMGHLRRETAVTEVG